MADIYIHSADGNDTTGDGSSSTPYQTIAKAFTEASAGDTIYPIANSTVYAMETDEILPSNITITAIAEDLTTTPYIQNPLIDHVVFDCDSTNKTWNLTDYLTVSNVIFKDFYTTNYYSLIDCNDATASVNATVTLDKVEFRDCSFAGSTATRGGLIGNGTTQGGSSYTDLTITLNQCIMNNVKLSVDAYYYGFIRCDGTVNVNTVNCTWYADATGTGVQTFANQGTFTGNLNSISHKNLIVKNLNTKTLDLGAGETESTAGLVYQGNITQTDNTTGVTNADPEFTDPANNIFHLKPTSPAIDGGLPL